MQRFLKLLLVMAFTSSVAVPHAFAHAFLDHAVPGVGMTVSGPVRELRIYFTQGVVTAFSHVHVVSAAGAQIPVSKPVGCLASPSKWRSGTRPANMQWRLVAVLRRL